MNDKLKFRCLQIHLSTAIALMIVAGALLGANLHPKRVPPFQGEIYGWPLEVVSNLEFRKNGCYPADEAHALLEKKLWDLGATHSECTSHSYDRNEENLIVTRKEGFQTGHALLNLLIGLLMLAGIGRLLEFAMRRREANQP